MSSLINLTNNAAMKLDAYVPGDDTTPFQDKRMTSTLVQVRGQNLEAAI